MARRPVSLKQPMGIAREHKAVVGLGLYTLF